MMRRRQCDDFTQGISPAEGSVKVYLCRQDSRLVEYFFRPCVRSPHGQRWNIDVHVVLDWLAPKRTREVQLWAFDVHVYLAYHPPGCSQSVSSGRVYTAILSITSRHTRPSWNTGGPVGCLVCWFLFPPAPLPKQLTDTDHLVQGYPFFSLLEGPGKTDRM